MKNNMLILISVIAVVVVGVASFFGGVQYQKSHALSGSVAKTQGAHTPGMPDMMAQRGLNRFAGGAGRPVAGKIVSRDTRSITLQLNDGSSKILNVTGTTTVSKTDTVALSDLKTGDTIAAVGITNADGSITVQNIQLNPMIMNSQGIGGKTNSSPLQPTR